MPATVSGSKGGAIKQVEERFETDRYGVDTITMKVAIPDAELSSGIVMGINSSHPRFSSTLLTRRSGVRSTPSVWTITYIFEGFLFEMPQPYYELQGSLGEEPIESHEDFITVIAGKPSAPLHGAVFVDPETGEITTDDAKGVFREFAATVGGLVNEKAGLESYLEPGAEWREISFSTTRPNTLSNLGRINAPSGPNPSASGRNWMYWSETYTLRGFIYQRTRTWKLSGRNGWDADVY